MGIQLLEECLKPFCAILELSERCDDVVVVVVVVVVVKNGTSLLVGRQTVAGQDGSVVMRPRSSVEI
jgi:hypothetical protein